MSRSTSACLASTGRAASVHAEFIDDVKRPIGYAPSHAKRRNIYIEHYFQTYSAPDMPEVFTLDMRPPERSVRAKLAN